MRMFLDYETRCLLDLRKVGAYRYTADPSFQVLLIAWAIDYLALSGGSSRQSAIWRGTDPRLRPG